MEFKTKEIMLANRSPVYVMTVFCALLLMASSCKMSRVKDLEAENARLQSDIVRSDSVQIQFMNAYAEIESNLDEIRLREKIINESSFDTEANSDVQKRILEAIDEIGGLMAKNRQRLQEMESLRRQLMSARSANRILKAKNETLKQGVDPDAQLKLMEVSEENTRLMALNQALEKTIARLKEQLAESEARIEGLQEELSLMEDAYIALRGVNDSLLRNEIFYLNQIQSKDSCIFALKAWLEGNHEAYYIVGTGKELKRKDILVEDGINSHLCLRDFTEVRDYMDLTSIETKSSKAELLSEHPDGSYAINDKDKRNLKIEIVDPLSFWSGSRVCVIRVK